MSCSGAGVKRILDKTDLLLPYYISLTLAKTLGPPFKIQNSSLILFFLPRGITTIPCALAQIYPKACISKLTSYTSQIFFRVLNPKSYTHQGDKPILPQLSTRPVTIWEALVRSWFMESIVLCLDMLRETCRASV